MKIQDYLKEQRARFEIHEHPPAYTAQEVAAEEHVSGNRLAKVVVVKADKEFAMCVLPASYKLDMEKVAAALADPQGPPGRRGRTGQALPRHRGRRRAALR